MNNKYFFIYLALMAGSTYLIRVIPFALVTKQITNKYIKSFLYYIPYAVLTAMTIPAIFFATGSIISAAVGFAVACLLALKVKDLTAVALISCVAVFLVDLFI